jgi:hypothetical protein
MNNMVLMIFNIANILQGALIYAVNTVFIPVQINLISLHLLYYLSKINLFMFIISIERSSFMECYFEKDVIYGRHPGIYGNYPGFYGNYPGIYGIVF